MKSRVSTRSSVFLYDSIKYTKKLWHKARAFLYTVNIRNPGNPAAPGTSRLVLLPSGPDTIHRLPPRRTQVTDIHSTFHNIPSEIGIVNPEFQSSTIRLMISLSVSAIPSLARRPTVSIIFSTPFFTIPSPPTN